MDLQKNATAIERNRQIGGHKSGENKEKVMPSKPKQKMPIEERAKQFMPFSALKGLEEALASKEKIIVPKKELTQDYAEELNLKLKSLKAGSIITVVYYCKEEYIKLTGMIAKINYDSRIIQIVNTKIPFDDLLDIIIAD